MINFTNYDKDVQIRIIDVSWEAAKLIRAKYTVEEIEKNILKDFDKCFKEILKTIRSGQISE